MCAVSMGRYTVSKDLELRIEQLEKQNADLRKLVGLLGNRLVLVENRPITGLGPDSPRVFSSSLVQAFDDLYKEGEATNEPT